MMVPDEDKRWLVVGIAMNKVAAPVLRDYIKQGMDTHYTNLDIYCSGLTTPCSLKTLTYHHAFTDPSFVHLKFQNVNNNRDLHNEQKHLYNYNINSSVDLAKLFLPDYLATFSAFDESLNMNAILHLLRFNEPAPIFYPLSNLLTKSVHIAADDVSASVWTKWCCCNVTDWTEVLFDDCFNKLETLVRSLGLTGGMEKTALDTLFDWQRKGRQLVMGHAMDQNLLSLVQQELKELFEEFSKAKSTQSKRLSRVSETVTGLQEQPSRKKARLDEHDAEGEKLQKSKKTSKQDIEMIMEKLVSVHKIVNESLASTSIKVKDIERGFATTRHKVVQLRQGLPKTEDKVELLEQGFANTDDRVKQLEQGFAKTDDNVGQLDQGFANAHDKVGQLDQGFANKGEIVKQVEEEFAKTDGKVGQLEQEVSKTDDKMKKLEQGFAKTDDKVVQLEQEFAKKDDKVEQLEQEFAKTDDKVEQLEQEFAKTDDKVEQLEQEFAKTDDKVVQLEQEFAKADDKVEQLEQGFANTDERVKQLEEEFPKTDDKVEQTEQEFGETDDKVDLQEQGFAKTDDKEEQLEQGLAETDGKMELLEQWFTKADDKVKQLERNFLSQNERENKSGASNMGDFNVKNFRRKLAEHYQNPSKVHSILRTSVLPSACQEDLDKIYIPLSWLKEEDIPAGASQIELSHYTELFTEKTKNGAVPKRILVQGETGIGKTTFVKKLLVDWSNLINVKMEEVEEKEDTLKRFDDDEGTIKDNDESSTDDEDMDKVSEESTTGDKYGDKDSGREGSDDSAKMDEKEQDALRMLDASALASSKCNEDTTEDIEESSTDNESSNGDDNLTEDTEESFADDKDIDEDIGDDVEINEDQKEALRKFELAIAVNLKEVSECQTLEEVITGSYMFPKEDKSLIDDLICYIYDNQDKVLFVLDGYNEYRMGSKTTSRTNSPIYNIFQGNDLPNCTVLVTTRSSRAEELLASADIHVKITGFNIYNRNAFMRKMLHSENQMESVIEFIELRNLEDLARVPLLTQFFCLLEKNERKKMECGKCKTVLYDAIVKHFLQHGHKKHSLSQVSKQNEMYYVEILLEIEKVALEGLLKGDLVFKCSKLPEKVRGEEGVIVGLHDVLEYGPSLKPKEVVSFIHKSIQEYLAACYINRRWVPEGRLGGLEQRTGTLEDCKAFENVFQFICGLSDKGAEKVFQHFASVRSSDATLDFSKKLTDVKNETDVPLFDVTVRHEDFSAMVLDCFYEVESRSELIRVCLNCTCGVVIVSPGKPLSTWMPEVKDLTRDPHSGVFVLVKEFSYRNCCEPPRSMLHTSLEFLECLDIPLKITDHSEVVKVEDFLKKYLNAPQCEDCSFRCMLFLRNGQCQLYITEMELYCDDHASLFTKTSAISIPFISTNLISEKSSLNFIQGLFISGISRENLKDFGSSIKDCKYLKDISLCENNDCVCDLLKQVLNPSTGSLEFGPIRLSIQGRIKTEAVELALLLPNFNVTTLDLNLNDCNAVEVHMLVSSITHIVKSLEVLRLDGVILTPAVATALGRSLPKISSLKHFCLTGRGEEILQDEHI